MKYKQLPNGQYEVFDNYVSGYGDSLESAYIGYLIADSRREYLNYVNRGEN